MQIENENNKMRRDLMMMEETKQNLEKLLYEQNVEVKITEHFVIISLLLLFILFSFGSMIETEI